MPKEYVRVSDIEDLSEFLLCLMMVLKHHHKDTINHDCPVSYRPVAVGLESYLEINLNQADAKVLPFADGFVRGWKARSKHEKSRRKREFEERSNVT